MRRLLIASTVLVLVSIVPASAQAATLSFSQPCYAAGIGSLPDQPIAFTLTGGTPGLRYTVKADYPGSLSTTEIRGFFDGAGNASGVFSSYNVSGIGINPSRGRPATFTATQGASLFGQAPIAQAGITVTNKALTIPVRGGFRKRTWKMSGVKPFYGQSSTYYASWVKGTGGKRVVKRSKLGRAKGACGYLAVKRVLPPARRSGSWTVYVHQGKKLDKKRAIAFPFRIFVF
jgi:hypothetical protein